MRDPQHLAGATVDRRGRDVLDDRVVAGWVGYDILLQGADCPVEQMREPDLVDRHEALPLDALAKRIDTHDNVAETSSALADQQFVFVLAGDKQGSPSFDVGGAEKLEKHAEWLRLLPAHRGLFTDAHVDEVVVLQLAFDPLALRDPAREVAHGLLQIGSLFVGEFEHPSEWMVCHRPRAGNGRSKGFDLRG